MSPPILFNSFIERILADALADHEGNVSVESGVIVTTRFVYDLLGIARENDELKGPVDRLHKTTKSTKWKLPQKDKSDGEQPIRI